MLPYKIATIDSGFPFVNNIGSLGFIAGCFLVGVGYGGSWVWFLNHSISCPKQLSLKVTFIV